MSVWAYSRTELTSGLPVEVDQMEPQYPALSSPSAGQEEVLRLLAPPARGGASRSPWLKWASRPCRHHLAPSPSLLTQANCIPHSAKTLQCVWS